MNDKNGSSLEILGASENNLQSLALSIPHNALVTLTGVSGSGKSSLAFSTIYAEGQRRYIETFSAYTRQFFDKVKKPNITSMHYVRPAIAIQQKTRITSSRSTIGSMTHANDLLKILYSNLAHPFSPISHKPFIRWSPVSLCDEVLDRIGSEDLTSIVVGALLQIPSTKKGRRDEIDRLVLLGYSRYYDPTTGSIAQLDRCAPADLDHQLFLVLDRIRPKTVRRPALLDSIEQAFQVSRGNPFLLIEQSTGKSEIVEYSSNYRDPENPDLQLQIPAVRPALFDPNSPIGACPECRGFGNVLEIDAAKVIPNPMLSIDDGAIDCWKGPRGQPLLRKLHQFAVDASIPTHIPWSELPEPEQTAIFEGAPKSFRGIRPWFKTLEKKAYKMHVRVFLAKYRTQIVCPKCNGGRLRPESLYFRILDKNMSDIWNTPALDLVAWTEEIERSFPHELQNHELLEVLLRFRSRLSFLCELGIPYLNLGRMSRTLSGGETQRVNLASALGSNLVSTEFVLDEPSVGLHPRDSERLIRSLTALRDQGNSVLVVEHDVETIRSSDYILELGPGGGVHGGTLTFQGTPEKWVVPRLLPPARKPRTATESIQIRGLSVRNLTSVDVAFPIGCLIALTGVSGSGKSTLMSEGILAAKVAEERGESLDFEIENLQQFRQVLYVDQSGLAKSPRANIATYSGLWDTIRTLFAETEEAKVRSLTKSSFSFNVSGGRCPACKGAGYLKEDMQFLHNVYVTCDLCLGKRFQAKVLEVLVQSKNISEWLTTTVAECQMLFHSNARVRASCEILIRLGLGHLTLGHSLSELSGGEAQRLKLVPFIDKTRNGKALLMFDEPTTGLHVSDCENLIELLHDLVDVGHTVICIEHNLDLIRRADWIIDLGPEGGASGGEVVLTGTPDTFLRPASAKKSLTAEYLQRHERGNEPPAVSASPSPSLHEPEALQVLGAKEHNLKNISLSLPHDRIIGITGVSGSGKSTIAKDIIYAEGQRRYLDCLSPYARQFIRELSKPNVEEVLNVRPTVCVYQHTFQPSELSTVGTLSEVQSFLRLLFAKVGDQHCPDHPAQRVSVLSPQQIAHELSSLSSEVRLLAPVVKSRKGHHQGVFERAIQSEIQEVRVDGEYGKPSQFLEGLSRNNVHSIEFVWARVHPKRVPLAMLESAIEEVFALGGGEFIASSNSNDKVFSRDRACPICHKGVFRPDPEDLSFHSRRGRCTQCEGSGKARNGSLCRGCDGTRITPYARSIRIHDIDIGTLSKRSTEEVHTFLVNLELRGAAKTLADAILGETLTRLTTLVDLGLTYLPLDRSCLSLSSGELQRLRIAASLGTELSGAMYIFDEPSAGLHPSDNRRVLRRFETLRNNRNTVLLIEHDPETLRSTDYIVEVGPGGGHEGGTITYTGPSQCYDFSVFDAQPDRVDLPDPRGSLTLHSVSHNNICDMNVQIPLGRWVVVAGVSGAGKSSLLFSLLLPRLQKALKKKKRLDTVDGLSIDGALERVLVVDQTPIGKNSRSTPASYLKIWDHVRKLFASTVESRARGWQAGFFSYNSGKGRCPECKGLGRIRLEMSFLAEAFVECEFCSGKRYTDEALSIQYLGKNISEVLQMTFEEAREHFSNHPKIHHTLHQAVALGLGYLTLGQSSITLSGGESQRIKLVQELSSRSSAPTLYLLDEPSRGLHKKDVEKLIRLIRRLVAKGHSVLTIEHDPDIIQASDTLIELGPGPGPQGGKIIFQGSPKDLEGASTPWGKYFHQAQLVA